MKEKNNNLISVFIDEEEIQVPAGINMIEAARLAGKEVPHYCYHPKLSVTGNCRMCLMEYGMPLKDRATGEPILDRRGLQKIGWLPRPAIACATKALPDIHIRTDSQLVRDCRNGVMEFLLINHPLDCPICDQAGECSLQEYATDYGQGYSRFVENKNVKPKRTRLGPRVMLDDERCILCSRCIRFCKEVAKDDVLGFIDRGSYSTLTCFPGKELQNNYSLNTVDICPVGALTSLDFRFKMRVWFLKERPSICTESSVGVNTLVGSREGEIYRITPRRNDEVNDTWMPDSGRVLYKAVDSDDRLVHYTVGGKPTPAEEAAREAAALLEKGSVAIVGSGQASVEEQYLLRKMAHAVEAVSVSLVSRTGEGDGLLISADRNSNVRGSLLTGLVKTLPEANLTNLAEALESGGVKTILSLGEDLTACGISRELLQKANLIYFGTHCNETGEVADVVFPTLTVFEKSGTFINQQFRLQKFQACVPGPTGVSADIFPLSQLLCGLDSVADAVACPNDVWAEMRNTIPEFAGVDFDDFPDTGLLINGSRWERLPFIEGKSLHHEPTSGNVKTGEVVE